MPGASSDRLLSAVLAWTAFTFVLAWLPLVRSILDGPSYTWGKSYYGVRFGGSGTGGDLWLLAVESGLGVLILWLGCRGPRRPFYAGLAGWHLLLTGNAVHQSWAYGQAFRFRGDTLGIDISLRWAGPLLFSAFLALCLLWIYTDVRSGPRLPRPRWSGSNRKLIRPLAALLPLQFVLLRFGEPHGVSDQVGVLVTIAQWMLLPLALWPREPGAA